MAGRGSGLGAGLARALGGGEHPQISARQLAPGLVLRGDIPRGSREVLVLTSAPVARAWDSETVEAARAFPGRKGICGGPTAGILNRELEHPLVLNLTTLDPEIPPVSSMEGFNLVTESAITRARISVPQLEFEESPDLLKPKAATQLAGILLDSDIIHILAGTKINEALQDRPCLRTWTSAGTSCGGSSRCSRKMTQGGAGPVHLRVC